MRLALFPGMSVSARHYDDYEDSGDRHRGRRAGRRQRALIRRAHRRAEDRTDLYEDVVKFAVVTFLLLIFLRPIGVIVGICWGLKLLKRYREDEPWPGMRRRARRTVRRTKAPSPTFVLWCSKKWARH